MTKLIDVSVISKRSSDNSLIIPDDLRSETLKNFLSICDSSPVEISKKISCAEGVSSDSFPLLLDTLAQLRTDPPSKPANILKKRAVAKYKTIEIILKLIELDSPNHHRYWNTFHCCNVLLQDGKKITGRYCNNRWCIVCNRIRTANLINGYLPVIRQKFKEPMFVTLTIPNISEQELQNTIREMTKTIRKITDLFRNRRDFRLKGIRKLECTYNEKGKDFHPHLHILVESLLVAKELVKAWLNHYPDADKRGQDIRPADQNSMIELFKYSTKLAGKSKNDVEALDVIFKAFYKKRVFQPVGLKKVTVSEDIEALQSQEIEDLKSAIDVWIWEQEIRDWLNSSGELLTEYQDK
jgi:plasmid rolling circle replication initiator protein Rep